MPSATPTSTPSVPPDPTPAPTPDASTTIGAVRLRPIGSTVTVVGVVTTEAGRLGLPPLLAIGDADAGIVIRLPDGAPAPARGRVLRVTGKLAAPFGQLEVRPDASAIEIVGLEAPSTAQEIAPDQLGETTEARLVVVEGTQVGAPRRSATGDITIEVVAEDGRTFRVMSDASSGITIADLSAGATRRYTGIVGQRASKKDALDGYRLWLRDRADIGAAGPGGTGVAAAVQSSAPADGGKAPGAFGSPALSIAAAGRLSAGRASVAGVVTAGPGLLDADGRRIVIQDETGAIEVVIPAGSIPPASGSRIGADGTVGRAWGAPRLLASGFTVLASGTELPPRALTRPPGEADEWQLVRVAGTVAGVSRLGDHWRADVRTGGIDLLVTGLAGAGIASTTLEEGRVVTIVGIVRRPYPTATDRRWAITPRGPWDVTVGPATGSGSAAGAGARPASGTSGSATAYAGGSATGAGAPADADLAVLADHVGALVRVGGLVASVGAGEFQLDDGTAIGSVVLRGEAAAFLDLIHAGDAIGLVGRVERAGSGLRVGVDDPAGLVRLGGLGEIVPISATSGLVPSPAPDSVPGSAAAPGQPTGMAGDGWPVMIGLTVACLAVVGAMRLRRHRADRRLAAVVLGRVAGLRRTIRVA
jgi:DNA/RNA endonuclease YhcR with UshA esterase domain